MIWNHSKSRVKKFKAALIVGKMVATILCNIHELIVVYVTPHDAVVTAVASQATLQRPEE
jgi:hypothetical protein